ncbi:MAG: LytTR family DNA-binding domain-containing protein [Bacteroidetes bacterium]|jgi:two-component system LytT family response regulator|nr:LytTR family DNA-binding domain-containing protein [Bacteroidota bacterium]
MTCIIIDDEPNARMSIKGILEENYPNVLVLAEAGNVPEAVKAINKYKPNFIFLDIEMPNQNGFALLDYFDEDEIDFKIVFVTAYSEYSLQAFEMSAVDYILKPARVESIGKAIKKVESLVNLKESYKTLKENIAEHSDKKLVLQTAETIYVVKLDDIIFIQAEGNYTKFHTTSHNVLTITKKIAEFEYLEKTDSFFRSHRSFIINVSKIKKVDKKEFVIIMNNDEQAYLAQDKKQALIEKIEKQ